MFGAKSARQPVRTDSLVGAETVVEGNVTFSGGLRIDGQVRGSVIGAPGAGTSVVLSEGGRIDGEVRATNAIVNGSINGPIHGAEYVELQSRAVVRGDVYYRTIEIQLGAVVEGRLVHQDAEGNGKVVSLKPQQTVSE